MSVTRVILSGLESATAATAKEVSAATNLVASACVWDATGAGVAVKKLVQAREPLTNFADELSYGIRRSYWSNLIGDDVSGRVPAKIAWEMMRMHAADSGTPAPRLFFMSPGHKMDNSEKLSQLIGQNPFLRNGRTLLVTDYIQEGRTVQQFASALQRHAIPFDVASVSALDAPVFIGPGLRLPRSSALLLSHESISHRIWLYSKLAPEYREAIGVDRYPGSVISHAVRTNQPSINELRERMRAVSEFLYQTRVKR